MKNALTGIAVAAVLAATASLTGQGSTSAGAAGSAQLTRGFSGATGSIAGNVGPVTIDSPLTVIPATTSAYTVTLGGVAATATGTAVPVPTIISFAANPTTITAGNDVQLTGVFGGGTGTITPDNTLGTLSATTGIAVSFSPAVTTTYMLTVDNGAGGVVTAQAKVTVVPAPSITGFGANPTSITVGDTTQLTPTFSGSAGSVDNGVGEVASGTPVMVMPAATTTYTLTVTNTLGATVTGTATVTVVPAACVTNCSAG